jgi:ubiquinone/menaquinone biosynthesis C-methylase UbiE
MNKKYSLSLHLCVFLLFSSLAACGQQSQEQGQIRNSEQDHYQYRQPTSRDGTGKIYMGRDIAQVMGHRGAPWLERSARKEEERTDLLLRALELEDDDVVADIGAGSGYFTLRLSKLVPQGKVLAVDIQPEMLEMIEQKMQQHALENVETILGEIDNPALPEAEVDLVLMVDAYHEFSHPREMMEGIVASLAPGGRVVLAEYRQEDPDVMIKPRHKMSEAQVVKEMKAVGLSLIVNKDVLPQQHLLFFGKTND